MATWIDLRQLRCFVAVAETLHFGRAAERLHMTQPPLTRQIRQTEEALGVSLFLRSQAGTALTAAGAALLPEARKTLSQAARAVNVVQAAGAAESAPTRSFVLGYTTVVDRGAVPDVAARLQRGFPGLRVVTRGDHSIRLIRALHGGRVDAAFIGLHTQADGLVVEPVWHEPFVAALPSAHPLARRRQLGFADLQGQPIFWFERRLNPGFHDHCADLFARCGFRFQALIEPEDHHILLGSIAEGQGIGLIPRSLQTLRRPGVVFRPLKGDASALVLGIGLAYVPGNRSPVLAALRAGLSDGQGSNRIHATPVHNGHP